MRWCGWNSSRVVFCKSFKTSFQHSFGWFNNGLVSWVQYLWLLFAVLFCDLILLWCFFSSNCIRLLFALAVRGCIMYTLIALGADSGLVFTLASDMEGRVSLNVLPGWSICCHHLVNLCVVQYYIFDVKWTNKLGIRGMHSPVHSDVSSVFINSC